MRLFTSLLFLIIFNTLSAQKSNNIGLDITTSKVFEKKKTTGIGPCEPSIAINPTNPNNIVIGSVIDYYHYTTNGGKTWKTKHLKSTLGVWGDPCIVADADGVFYYFHLSDPDGTNWKSKNILDRIVVQRSFDGGKTWDDGFGIGKERNKQQDKEWATVDPKTGNLYVTWTEFDKYGSNDPKEKSRILFSQSTDKGKTWSDATPINQFDGNAEDDDLTSEGAVPAVDSHGNIYVSWSYNDMIFFDKSSDGKKWLSQDIVVSDQPMGWAYDIPGIGRANGMPITKVDNSKGKYQNRIYVNWSDMRNGEDNTDIFIAYSDNHGDSWSKPIRVNNDKTKNHQFFCWMDIDSTTGYIYIIYYDRSAHDDENTDVQLAVSRDGGNTFQSTLLSQKSFKHKKDIFFGDYNNINTHNGIITAVWTHSDNGKLSIWTSIIKESISTF